MNRLKIYDEICSVKIFFWVLCCKVVANCGPWILLPILMSLLLESLIILSPLHTAVRSQYIGSRIFCYSCDVLWWYTKYSLKFNINMFTKMNSFKNAVADLQPGNYPEPVTSTSFLHNRTVVVQMVISWSGNGQCRLVAASCIAGTTIELLNIAAVSTAWPMLRSP